MCPLLKSTNAQPRSSVYTHAIPSPAHIILALAQTLQLFEPLCVCVCVVRAISIT